MGVAEVADRIIVRAAIHPAIGVARIGDSATECFVGPEVVEPANESPSFYRDHAGALKRQAARFRLYGLDAQGAIVRELTPASAEITWTVHLANKKAQWFQFQAALDIPDAAAMSVPLRNPDIKAANRGILAIDPGPRSISGISISGGSAHSFDTGKFKDTVVPLGELRTDDAGRLLVLGGTGRSASPSGAPVFNPDDGNSFNNADDWYDDISDGPVTASVAIGGRAIPVDPAWVIVGPPNYAPEIVGWRTLYDLLTDAFIESGRMAMPPSVSFGRDILPVLQRLSNLQWVNKGFAAMFGKGGPMDFNDPALIGKLATVPDPSSRADPYGELRQIIYNCFLPSSPKVAVPPNWPHAWPWIYGDAYGSFAKDAPDNSLSLSPVRESLLKSWVQGHFTADWPPAETPPRHLDEVPLAGQPAMLDKAALHFCLADAFHPGCEVTWPIRHPSMFEQPFRIRHRPPNQPEPDYGTSLDQQIALQPNGPLFAQGPGDLTRWMALPWQGDTAFCRSGYDYEYDLYVPTFWPARVPNQILTEEDYRTVMDTSLPRSRRLAAFANRPSWLRAVTMPAAPVAEVMLRMVAHFGDLGIVEARPGIAGDPDFPPVMHVETLGTGRLKEAAVLMARELAAPTTRLSRVQAAGWVDEEQHRAFRRIRVRHG